MNGDNSFWDIFNVIINGALVPLIVCWVQLQCTMLSAYGPKSSLHRLYIQQSLLSSWL